MAKTKRTEERPAPPAISPPGRVSNTAVHGPQSPVAGPKAPIDELRDVLGLSGDVPADRVIAEAVDRLRAVETETAGLP